ncbi:hypothetical protein D910_09208 [Dendroctonus ponderosae]|uniref:Uncharacterized protein n=1 Tax=Dendroctonus ponderosae TaxID=77166 RepID=U4UD50_DENPD|nr:hypothetical protein D910_09208 [Dendroctonus ponderosae]
MPIFLCIYFCDIAYKAVCNLSVALLSASTTFNEDIEVREKLKDVSYKIRVLHSDFTAARFLTVDRKLAVALLYSIGSYFLVIQQAYIPRQ